MQSTSALASRGPTTNAAAAARDPLKADARSDLLDSDEHWAGGAG